MSNRRNTKKSSPKSESIDNRYLQTHDPVLIETHEVHTHQNSVRYSEGNDGHSKRSSDNISPQNPSSRHISNAAPSQGNNSWRSPRDSVNNELPGKKHFIPHSHRNKPLEKIPEEIEHRLGNSTNADHSRHNYSTDLGYNQNNIIENLASWHAQRFQMVIKNGKNIQDSGGHSINNGLYFYDNHPQYQPKHSLNNNNFISMCEQAFSKLQHQRNQSAGLSTFSYELNGTSPPILTTQPYSTSYSSSMSLETSSSTNHNLSSQANSANSVGAFENVPQFNQTQISPRIHKGLRM